MKFRQFVTLRIYDLSRGYLIKITSFGVELPLQSEKKGDGEKKVYTSEILRKLCGLRVTYSVKNLLLGPRKGLAFS